MLSKLSGLALQCALLTALALTTGCGGSSPSSANGGSSPAVVQPSARSIYVVQQTFPAPGPGVDTTAPVTTSILKFSAAATGPVAPIGVITPPPGIFFYNVATDPAGNIYAYGLSGPIRSLFNTEILVYPVGAAGNTTPSRIITGEYLYNSGYSPSLAADSSGTIYLGGSSVDIYGVADNGPVPTRTINGPANATALAVDSSGDVYEADGGYPHLIDVYGAGASGLPTPLRTITDGNDNTGLDRTIGLALDNSGSLYVTYQNISNSNSIQVYAPGISGQPVPVRTIAGPSTTLLNPTGIAVDSAGYIYVADYVQDSDTAGEESPSVKVFSPAANGNVAPLSTFSSAQWTGVTQAGIAIH